MHIHVVGLGAVGSFVAFHLRRTLAPKHSVVALHRKESAPAVYQGPHGWSVILEADRVTHTQDGIVHLSYSLFSNKDHKKILPSLRSIGQRRGDFRLPLSRHGDAHGILRLAAPINTLIVTTKAFAVPSVMWALREYITRDTTIVLLHNGMGVHEHLVRHIFDVPRDRPNFVLCTNTHGLYRKDLLHVVQTGVGEIQLGIAPDPLGRNYEEAMLAGDGQGPYPELSLDDIANPTDNSASNARYINLRNTITALTSARALGATWRPYRDVLTGMRRKLTVNALVNPLTALLQCKNGCALNPPHGRWVMKRICEEAETVFKAQCESENKARHGAYLEMMKNRSEAEEPPPPPSPIPFPHSLTASSLGQEVERVVEQTKHNYSSMYHDLKHDRPTEIEYINGHIRGLAQLYNKSALVNETLYQLVKMRSAYPFVAKPS